MRAFGKDKRRPIDPEATTSVDGDATIPITTVLTGHLSCNITSKMAKTPYIEPPALLIYNLISLLLFWASSESNEAITWLDRPSLIRSPRKIVLLGKNCSIIPKFF